MAEMRRQQRDGSAELAVEVPQLKGYGEVRECNQNVRGRCPTLDVAERDDLFHDSPIVVLWKHVGVVYLYGLNKHVCLHVVYIRLVLRFVVLPSFLLKRLQDGNNIFES